MTKPKRPTGTTIPINDPELVFGIVGPIGVDMDAVVEALCESLRAVNYSPEPIHLTDLIRDKRIKVKLDFSTYFLRYKSLIKYANAYRKLAKNAAALAGIAIVQIRALRAGKSKSEMSPARGTAYVIRQFKRPEEIDMMRRVYGRKFIQVSVYGSAPERRQVLMDKIRRFDPSPKTDAKCEAQAIELIDTDHNESEDVHGQRVSDVFHLGDVFVNGIDKSKAKQTIDRFVRAFFGDTKSSPSKDEYGLYIASAAALRSADLSRQVGAAIFSSTGEIVTLGCNEVPKSDGGTYWTDDKLPIFRDVDIGSDANHDRKNEIFYDLVDRLNKGHFLSKSLTSLKSPQKQLDALLTSSKIRDAQMMDIIEFGRMIHAEMSAISDAARLGRPTKGATLFCTTFPCHLCAKHIVAAGINRVVFLEPYPKSYSQKLHGDSITFETHIPDKVYFQPFIGISPRRYRDIFEKRKRKDENGKAREWYEGKPVPLLEDRSAAYIENEEPSAYVALRFLRQRRPSLKTAKQNSAA
ncbi:MULTISPECIES: anti-phage dCTP deaminase [Rhodopseudomonas]|uniref:anti-phage dCTP deaminase n=1 Tax=Rhodopseudomonas TaxID=1073 RepID=UPI001F3915FF|nr:MULTISPECIES: anti-phage dCTP deaminase [Rhodopseudomonas]WOK19419.1 anti-phage dCTP deaminase [Rhodopseudomonas sp. BAL398]